MRAPDSTPTQGTAQAVTLLSAKQAQAVDCVVYRANVSMTPDKQAGKTHELKTREEMNPVLAAVQQKVWTPTGESWEVKMNPSLPLYTLLLQVNGNTQLELGLCGDLERAGYVAVKKDGKMTCYEVPGSSLPAACKSLHVCLIRHDHAKNNRDGKRSRRMDALFHAAASFEP